MRILISAYACEPEKGSEPEVGLQVVLAAATEHDVWLITRGNNLNSLNAFLADHPLRSRIHPIGLELDAPLLRIKHKGGNAGLQLYYHLWQRKLASEAQRLDGEIDFDVVHHATFATYWSKAGIAEVDKPFVWGPVGGGVKSPLRLMPTMGLKGGLGDLARFSFRPILASLNRARRTARRASVTLVQNPETRAALGSPPDTIILPNGLLGAVSLPRNVETPSPGNEIVSAGRLIGWKGVALAIRTMQHLPEQHVLAVYGDGADRRRLERLTARLGLEDRVTFHGRVSRDCLLEAILGAGAYLHPALHEDSSLGLGEALGAGTPAVCLDRGGPPVLLGFWPHVPTRAVPPSTPQLTARRLATAVSEVIGQRGARQPEGATVFRDRLLAAYEKAAH